jgi:uncharacterized iron-regulated membrane protein
MTHARAWILRLHLWIGLPAALFLLVIGLSGAVIAFENDYDRWLNPHLWKVTPAAHGVSQQALLDTVLGRVAPAHVVGIFMQDGRPDAAQRYVASDDRNIFANPYTGAVLGIRDHAPRLEAVLRVVHQLHIRLVHIRLGSVDVGKAIVEIAGIAMLVLLPSGFWLWWRRRQLTLNFKANWKRITWDLHSMTGIYAFAFLLLMSVTGFFISFEEPLYWATNSPRYQRTQPPHSVAASTRGGRANLDSVLAAADAALPGQPTVAIGLPEDEQDSYDIEKRAPDDRSATTHGTVYVDQYSGRVLRVDDFDKIVPGYRAVRINRSLHTGDWWGLTGHIVLSLTSLMLTLMVITGVTIWWRKLESAQTSRSHAPR